MIFFACRYDTQRLFLVICAPLNRKVNHGSNGTILIPLSPFPKLKSAYETQVLHA